MSVETLEVPAKTKRPYVRRPKALEAAAAVPVVVPDHTAALTDALARIVEKIGQIGTGSLTAEGLAKALESNRVAQLPSNPDHNYQPASVFAPHDPLTKKPLPKATLVREVFVNAAREKEDALRPDEVDAFNVLSASLPNPGMVRTSRAGKWRASVNAEGTRLQIIFPCKGVDDMLNGPKSLIALCSELTDGKPVETVDGMLAQMNALKKQNEMIMALLAQHPELAQQASAASA